MALSGRDRGYSGMALSGRDRGYSGMATACAPIVIDYMEGVVKELLRKLPPPQNLTGQTSVSVCLYASNAVGSTVALGHTSQR